MRPNSIEVLNNAIKLQESMIEGIQNAGEESPTFDRFVLECLKELMEYKKYELTPEVCRNYKIFEDECIRDGVTFDEILKLKDQLKEKKKPTAEWIYVGGILYPIYQCSKCGGRSGGPNYFCQHCGTKMKGVVRP